MTFTVGQSLGEMTKQPDEVQMFTFAAAVWNQHRIHYDRERARAEGHHDLVVENAMRASWLGEFVLRAAGAGGWVSKLTYRHVGAAYVNEKFTVSGTVTDVSESGTHIGCVLSIAGPGGDVTVGTAEFRSPGGTLRGDGNV